MTERVKSATSASATVTDTWSDCPSLVAVMPATPAPTAVTVPSSATVATAGSVLAHATTRPGWSIDASSVALCPTVSASAGWTMSTAPTCSATT